MGQSTLADFSKMKFQARVSTSGPTPKLIMESGPRTRCTAVGNSTGKTTRSILVNLCTTNVRAMVFSLGEMAASTMANGAMVSRMVKESLLKSMVANALVSGQKVRILCG